MGTQQSGSQPNQEPIVLTDTSFFPEISKHPLMVVDFWALWCDPCKLVSPVIDELARDYAGKVTFGKLNVEDNSIVSDALGVENIPTILVFKQRRQVDGLTGEASKSSIEDLFKPYLENDNPDNVI